MNHGRDHRQEPVLTAGRYLVVEHGTDGKPLPGGLRSPARITGAGAGYLVAVYDGGGYHATGLFGTGTGKPLGDTSGTARRLRLVPDWDCEAYGRPGPAAGMLCFYADPGYRNCGSHAECAASVDGARQLLFGMMKAKAAAGNPQAAELAETFTSPDQPLRWPVKMGDLPYVDQDARRDEYC